MADVPVEVPTGRIVCRLSQLVSTFTAGEVPDEIPGGGTVTFTPSVAYLRLVDVEDPRIAAIAPVTGEFVNGELYVEEAMAAQMLPAPGVPMLATVQDAAQPSSFEWVAHFDVPGLKLPDLRVTVAPGGVTDLAMILPSAPQPGTVTIVSHEDRLVAEDAAEEATGSATAAAGSASAAAQSASDADADRAAAQTAKTDAETARTQAQTAAAAAQAATFLGTIPATGVDFNTLTTPGVYDLASAVIAASSNVPATGTNGGVLEIFTINRTSGAAGYLLQRFQAWGQGRSIFSRINNAGTWSAWTVIPVQRVDQTAGRVIYTQDPVNSREQIIYGDTGWRDISTLLPAGVAKSAAANAAPGPRIRRVGNLVQLELFLDITTAGIASIFNVPAGFRGYGTITRPGAGFSAATVASALPVVPEPTIYLGGSGATLGRGSAFPINSTFQYSGMWTTTDAWPTTLPGTALGTIPNA